MDTFSSCTFWWFLLGVFVGFLFFWLYWLFFMQKNKQQESDLSKKSELPKALDLNAALSYGFKPKKNGVDDLTLVEGIGPKISQILISKKITTFEALSTTPHDTLQTILNDSGPAYKLAKPDSWPKQAKLAHIGDWEELKNFQDRLVGGVEFNTD